MSRTSAAVLLALPWLLLAIDRTWAASALFLDPYIYVGYFLDLPGHLHAFPTHYISTRLPVLVPGWIAHRLLPPLAASLGLRLALFYTSVFSLHHAVRLAVGP